METTTMTPLTSAEIGKLWGSFLSELGVERIFKVFSAHCEDQEIQTVMETALKFSHQNQKFLTSLFNEEGLTRPIGFADKDIHPEAPKMYKDLFYLYYLIFLAKAGVITNGFAIIVSTRNDVIDYYEQTIQQSELIYRMAKKILLKQGSPFEAPTIPLSNQIDMADNQSYLGKMLGSQRKLNCLEGTELYAAHMNAFVIHQLMNGFSQLKIQPEFHDYFTKYRDLTAKHQKSFQSKMEKEDVPTLPFENLIYKKEKGQPSPFSEKLMLTHSLMFGSFLLTNYGHSISLSFRKDLSLDFGKKAVELDKNLGNGAKLLIDNGWLEEPPQII